MSSPTKFDLNQINSLFANAKKLFEKTEAKIWWEFSGARPKISQAMGVP